MVTRGGLRTCPQAPFQPTSEAARALTNSGVTWGKAWTKTGANWRAFD